MRDAQHRGRRQHHHLAHQAHPPQVPGRGSGVRRHRHRLRHGLPLAGMKRLRFGLRVKLALLLARPARAALAGVLVRERDGALAARGAGAALLAAARAVATALHDRPQLLASASGRDDEVDAILLGLPRTSSRIWVVDRGYQVHRLGGQPAPARVDVGDRCALVGDPLCLFGRLADPAPDRGFRRVAARGRARDRPDVAAALQGTPATRTRHTRDGRRGRALGGASDLGRRRVAARWSPRRRPTP